MGSNCPVSEGQAVGFLGREKSKSGSEERTLSWLPKDGLTGFLLKLEPFRGWEHMGRQPLCIWNFGQAPAVWEPSFSLPLLTGLPSLLSGSKWPPWPLWGSNEGF